LNFSLYFNSEITIDGLMALFTRDKTKMLEREELRISDLAEAVREKRLWR